MNKNIKRSLYFLLGLFVADGLAFILMMLFSTYFQSEDYSLAKYFPKSDVLVIGTSHAGEGFSPAIIKKELDLSCYNLGRARRNTEFNYYMSRYILNQRYTPKMVVIVNSYHDLTETTKPYMITSFVENREEWFDLTFQYAGERNWVPGRSFFYCDRYSPDIRMNLSRSISWLKNRRRDIPYREHPDRGFHAVQWSLVPQTKEEGFKTYKWHFEKKKMDILEATIQLWRKKGVKVILCDPPEFFGTLESKIEYETFETEMHKLAKRNDCTFVSFNRLDLEWNRNEDYFKDGGWGNPNSHMNRKGAQRFTNLFCHWLKTEKLVP